MNNNERLTGLDGYRGLACISIIFCHYYGACLALEGEVSISLLPYSKYISCFYQYGSFSVNIFFWISGLLIAYRYKNSIKDMTYIAFIKKRFRTLYPGVFVSVTVGLLLAIVDQLFTNGVCVQKTINLYKVVMSYSMMFNGWGDPTSDTPFGSGLWFICSLFLCYSIWYILNTKFANNYHMCSVLFFLLGWAINRGAFSEVIPFTASVSWGKGTAFIGFFGGVIFYEIFYGELKEEINFKFSQTEKNIIFVIISFVILCFRDTSMIVFVLVYCPFSIWAILNINFVNKFFELKLFRSLGKISMSIYLSHVHVINSISIVMVYFNLRYSYLDKEVCLFTIFTCILVGLLWYYFIEKKFAHCFISYIRRHKICN